VEPDHNFIANGIVVHNCIIAMESMACGTPIVAIQRGALAETCGDRTAVWVGDETGDPHAPEHREAFADALVEMQRNGGGWDIKSKRCRERAADLDWSGVAAQWAGWWIDDLRARSEDPRRFEAHLRRIGDHEGLRWFEGQKRVEEGQPCAS
jgi:hypothetical protein